MILWYSGGDDYYFDLDAVRVPQKYPGKKWYRGDRKGAFSGNPKGKNSSNVWSIPNVKANHPEKTDHQCQFPVALVQRLIRALTPVGGVVLDPFLGAGSTGVACIIEGRRFVGIELDREYHSVAVARYARALHGTEKYRDVDAPTYVPPHTSILLRNPFAGMAESG